MTIPEKAPFRSLSPSVEAAVFIFARQLLRERGVDDLPSSGEDVATLTGCSRSQAYAMRDRLEEACRRLTSAPGRPASVAAPSATQAILEAVRDFLYEHPGVATGNGERRRYSDPFRVFVIGLFAPSQPAEALTVEQAAQAIGVPLGTLKDWLSAPKPELGPTTAPAGPASEADEADEADEAPSAARYTSHPDIAVILTEYPRWEGDFGAFCDHLRVHHRLQYGRTFIASVLEAAGLRSPVARKGARVPWSKHSFRRLFPGAQWLGDGTALGIEAEGQRFVFNLEAIQDVDSNAIPGIAVTDVEDEAALVAAFEQAVHAAGEAPLALTLDNRSSNHTAGVLEAVKPTEVLPATPGRGQAKAGLEGAFGLFAQTAPPLVVQGATPRERARSMLRLLVTLWAWTRNGKPQRGLGGKSPRERYREQRPTSAQLEAARAWIAELRRRHRLALETRARRADPVRRDLIRSALRRFDIADADDRLANAIATYGTEAILQGLAVFEAKRQQGTVPLTADPGRYLAGIIRNIDTRLELAAFGEHLLDLRQRAKDLTLAPLERERDALTQTVLAEKLPFALVNRALEAKATIDFRFWAKAACQALSSLAHKAADRAHALVRLLLSAIACAFTANKERRQQLVAALTRAVVEAS